MSLRTAFGHGPRAFYYRDIVRQRILRTPPIPDTDDYSCELHVLTSAPDWLNLIWALKSFYRFSKTRYALCIHEDGTLPESAGNVLRRHFPKARIIQRKDAEPVVLDSLADFPRCRHLRQQNTLSMKLFDFRLFLNSDRLLLLDSDVLFFAHPTELIRRIADPLYRRNSVNADIADAYTVSSEAVFSSLGFPIQPRFNSGLGLIHRDSLDLESIETFLSLPGILGHFWRIEQTLFALCSSKYGVELLPRGYDVRLTGRLAGTPCRHYVGEIRQRMYDEGIRTLVKTGFLHVRH